MKERENSDLKSCECLDGKGKGEGAQRGRRGVF